MLFVSEKMAALEVVQRRLTESGLGAFCLELHSRKANKREVVQSMARAWSQASLAAGKEEGVLAELGGAACAPRCLRATRCTRTAR